MSLLRNKLKNSMDMVNKSKFSFNNKEKEKP